MNAIEARPMAELTGGRAAFDRSHQAIIAKAALAQARFTEALDRIGPPGASRWDPVRGEVELRGHVFSAEQLGSFDGQSWLWSWANPYLAIPAQKTVIARRLRDAAEQLGIPALAVPMITVADERLPYIMGDLAVGHGFAEAYWVANRSQAYAICPGQIRVEQTADGHPLRKLGLCFVPKKPTLREVRDHLLQGRGLEALPIVEVGPTVLEIAQPGLTVRITRSDRLKDVMREAKLLGQGQAEAQHCATVLIVETAIGDDYRGVRNGIFRPLGALFGGSWAPIEAQALAGTLDPSPAIPLEALLVCERLHQIKGALVYDLPLRALYGER